MNKFKKGFTLIELLMVVAIIGIAAAITVASLSTSRAKGADAAVKSNLNVIRSQAELFFANNGNSFLPSGGATFSLAACPSYDASGTNMLSKDKVIADAITEANNRGGNASSSRCYNSSLNWFAAIPLKTDSANGWCVDSGGNSKQVTMSAVTGSITACP